MPAERVFARLDELYAVGATRLGLSEEESRACMLAARWMEAAGLAVEVDAAGNVFGRRVGARPELPEVWTGSHLDTVPTGGRFDGALGVVAGIEAVAALPAPVRTVAVVAFRDEEGVRFGGGCFGSRALCGRLDPDELEKRDADGVTVREALARLGLRAPPAAGWLDGRLSYFVELHVEQGPRLADAGAPLAVVTAIVGTSGTRVVFSGSDAVTSAAELVLRVRELALERDAVATVGQLAVVPAGATLMVDARAEEKAVLLDLLSAIEKAADAETARLWFYEPVPMAAAPRAALLAALQELGCPPVELVSLAGHDASVLAQAGVPTGMLFVRSGAGGVSHCPEEWSEPEDVALAVEALTYALASLSAA